MKYSQLWYLSKIGFLDSVPLSVSRAFLESIEHHFYKKNDVIQTPTQVVKQLCFVKEGCVRLYTLGDDGRQFTYSLLGIGSTYGSLSNIRLDTSGLYVDAVSNTHLCTISEGSFTKLANKYPILTNRLLEILSERLREREEMMKELALGSVEERVLHLLNLLYNNHGSKQRKGAFCSINIPLSQQEIANMVGSSREAVSMAMTKLNNQQLIRLPRRRMIEIHQDLLKKNLFPSYIQMIYK